MIIIIYAIRKNFNLIKSKKKYYVSHHFKNFKNNGMRFETIA